MRALNPFDPSRPIDPLKFVGRLREIEELQAALAHAKRSKPRHFLITGERGVGKTSFLDYIRSQAGSAREGVGEFNFAVVDFAINKQSTKLDFARALNSQLDKVLAAHPTHRETLDRIWGFIQRIEAAGFSYRGEERAPENHRDLHQEVADSLNETVKRICSPGNDEPVAGADGILILVDEVDQSSDELDIGSFLKYLLERLNRSGCHKVVVGLAGLPNAIDKLLKSHQSSLRIFDELPLSNLPREEADELLDEVQIFVRDDGISQFLITPAARNELYELSGGHPQMLHQLGYCAFEYACSDSTGGELVLEQTHVTAGAIEPRGAIDLIGDIYFREPFEKIRENDAVFAVADHLSETRRREAVGQISSQIGICSLEVKHAVSQLVSAGLLSGDDRSGYEVRHPCFCIWLKANYPAPAS